MTDEPKVEVLSAEELEQELQERRAAQRVSRGVVQSPFAVLGHFLLRSMMEAAESGDAVIVEVVQAVKPRRIKHVKGRATRKRIAKALPSSKSE